MTDFQKNSIIFDATKNPVAPTSSMQKKIFYDGEILKTISFDGKVAPLIPQQTLIETKVTVEEEADATAFSFQIPNFQKPIDEINAKLRVVSDQIKTKSESTDVTTLVDAINARIAILEATLATLDLSVKDNQKKLSIRKK